MRSRRFTLGAVGLGIATALTGTLVVTATGSGNDGGAADPTTTSGAGRPAPLPDIERWADFYASHPGGRSTYPSGALHPADCVYTADGAEHWIRETGHRPCEP